VDGDEIEMSREKNKREKEFDPQKNVCHERIVVFPV